MRPLTAREKKIACACAATIGVYTVYLIWQMTGCTSLVEMEQQINVLTKQRKKNEQVIAQGDVVGDAYDQYRAALQCADSDEETASSLAAFLSDAGKRAPVQITRIQPAKSVSVDALRRFPVDISLEGQFADIVHFLYLIEAAPALCAVKDLRMDTHTRKGASVIRAQLKIEKVCVTK